MKVVAFLGTRTYEPARYQAQDGTCSPEIRIGSAWLARRMQADELIVLATEKAEAENRDTLEQELKQHAPDVELRFVRIPTGFEPWQLFRRILESFADDEEVALDITHGFRSHPFFAAAALSHLRATRRSSLHVRVFYFEWSGGGKGQLWELTEMVVLLDWSQAIGTFLRTGNATEVTKLLKEQRTWAGKSGKHSIAKVLGHLGGAIERFSEDLAAVRVPHLLLGYDQSVADAIRKAQKDGASLPDRSHPISDAQRLLDAIADTQKELEKIEIWPLLRPMLEELQQILQPLPVATLAGKAGARAMLALARMYLRWSRLSEAATVLREAVLCLYATSEEADIGRPGFAKEKRAALEERVKDRLGERWRVLAKVRNDIDHAGFNENPEKFQALRGNLENLIKSWEEESNSSKVWFITRHPGAVKWARRRGIRVDRQLDHLTEGEIAKLGPGDVVIGILPIHLAAKVCEQGARYLHLSMDLPPEKRGVELSADEMERFGARLQEFEVRKKS